MGGLLQRRYARSTEANILILIHSARNGAFFIALNRSYTSPGEAIEARQTVTMSIYPSQVKSRHKPVLSASEHAIISP